MTRKIIHIATVPHENTVSKLVVLCDDGTLWHSPIPGPHYPMSWQQIAPPPQPPPRLDLEEITERQMAAVRPDFELPSSIVPTIGENAVRALLEEDITRIKTLGGQGYKAELAALEAHIAQKGMEVIRPSGLWFAGVHYGRKNP